MNFEIGNNLGAAEYVSNLQIDLFKKIIDIFENELKCPTPPLGYRPLKINPTNPHDGFPSIDSFSDISVYQMYLNPVNAMYDQLAYQYAHELCHIYINPNVTNWFIECVCHCMSQKILDELADNWDSETTKPYYPDQNSFRTYLKEHREKYRNETYLTIGSDPKHIMEWFKSTNDDLSDPNAKMRNKVFPDLLYPILEKHSAWNLLPEMGKSVTPNISDWKVWNNKCCFSIDKFRREVGDGYAEMVSEIEKAFPFL